MDNLLGTIILILPGLFAYNVSKILSPAETKQKTDFEKTVIALTYNLLGIIIWWVMNWWFTSGNLDFKSFYTMVTTMPNFLYYFVEMSLISVLLAFLWNSKWLNRLRDGMINKLRQSYDRGMLTSESSWELFWGSEELPANELAILRIYPMGQRTKFILGQVKSGFQPGSTEKGILLFETEQAKEYDPYFPAPLKTYVDINTKTVYEIFPASAVEEARHRAETKSKQPTQSFLS